DSIYSMVNENIKLVFMGEPNESQFTFNGEIYSIESTPIRKEDGEIYAGISIIRNITENRLWEIQMQYQEALIDLIFEISLVGLIIVDNNGKVTRFNEKFLSLWKKTKHEVVNKNIWEIFTIGECKITPESFHEQLLNKDHSSIEEKLNFNGEDIYLEVNQTCFKNIDEKDFLLIYLIDITERKKHELQIIEMNKGLEVKVIEEVNKNRKKDHLLIAQARMASMGEMIGNIAHQWRQPLSSLSGIFQNLADAIRYEELDEKQLDEFEHKVVGLIDYMSKTIDDFRYFFKPQKEIIKFKVLKECINKTLLIIESAIKKNDVNLILELGDEFEIEGYPGELSQVIINLINNSVDALKGVKKPFVKIQLTKQEDNLEIRVIDNAGGIPENIASKIFDPYFTTKEKGTGIGLYMSKMIVENSMNGSLEYKKLEDGSEFLINLHIIRPI
ncbi:MAG: PAS domain S-box protein, partial [Leptospiraceae bacterium]|nr:PAS domain S-box protein [Leptospiraceae bacterium]